MGECVMEVVKTIGGDVVSDEFHTVRQCPECGGDVLDTPYCQWCGSELDGASPLGTCKNMSSEPTFFLCSECGRLYVPVQVRKEGEGIDWNTCPGCGTRVEHA